MDKDFYLSVRDFINNYPLLSFIGAEGKNIKEIDKYIESEYMSYYEDLKSKEYKSSSSSKDYLDKLSMFIEKKEKNLYCLNSDYVMTLFRSMTRELLNGYSVVKQSDIENSEHTSYKYLYEKCIRENSQLMADNVTMNGQLSHSEMEIIELNGEIEKLKNVNSSFKVSSDKILDFISGFLDKDICVSGVSHDGMDVNNNKAITVHESEIGTTPGVYGGKRPSWFSAPGVRLDKKNISESNSKKTSGFLFSRLHYIDDIEKDTSADDVKCDKYDSDRRKQILDLINSDVSNEEKYIKYLLLTPGISNDFIKTLDGCSDLHLDASVVISLLEQPNEYFNKELVEAYVSKTHKASEYDYKQELAEELIEGKWYITADVNGVRQNFRLIPYDLIDDIKNQLKEVYSAIENGDVISNQSGDNNDDIEDSWIKELQSKVNLVDQTDIPDNALNDDSDNNDTVLDDADLEKAAYM